ncbi:MAG: GspE/PulE family protein [Elusimicrobiota bacterium]
MNKPLIGQILLKEGVISEEQLNKALETQKSVNERLGKILIQKGWAKEYDVLKALSFQFNYPLVNLAEQKIDKSLTGRISAKFSHRYNLVPINLQNDVLTVAVSDPLAVHAFDDLRLMFGCDVSPVLATGNEILKALKKLYGLGADTMEKIAADDETVPEAANEKESSETVGDEDASIVKFVNQIIEEAYHDRATDIHLEPFENDMIIRYRIDGILHEASIPPQVTRYQSAIISRIKIMADMDIAEKRLPQDGRIQFKMGDEIVDLRVSTLPVIHGESVDLRILPRKQMLLGLDQLGLPEDYQKKTEKLIKRPHGIILVTGPTGHGKTTTLYACLSKINSPDKKIITVEEPVEYQLKGINQIPVHSKIGLTFANGLRAILRQDPDVIMVGEIRDQETAEIAIRASLTGHLVFSTLHTNNAPAAVTRLVDMGIEPYLVASSIEAIMAQRLVRLVCKNCRVEDRSDTDFLKSIGFPRDFKGKIYKAGPGCEECRHTGYRGRTAIYELLMLDDELKKLVVEKVSAGLIKKEAIRKGMKTLRDDGWDKVRAGLTTLEEIIRVTQEEEILE